jgi:hypothetical protein
MASNSAHKKAVKKVDKQLKKEIKNKESTFDFYAMMPTVAIPRLTENMFAKMSANDPEMYKLQKSIQSRF